MGDKDDNEHIYIHDETIHSHQESSNEDFYECMNDYYDGTMCV